MPHGRQSRPAVRQKKSRTFPTGNALPSIDAFFKLGASFGAHPFSFIVKMERIRLSELSISGNVLGEALSERCPDSASRIKPKIRTLLLSRKGSDFHCLVRIRGLEQHGPTAGGATKAPVGLLLVRGSQPVVMSIGRPAAKIEKTPPICVMKRRWAVFCSIGLELASDTAHARLSMISAHFSMPMTPLSSAI